MNKNFTNWLFGELPVLVEKNILSEEYAQKVKLYYENQIIVEESKQKIWEEKIREEHKVLVSKRIPVVLGILSALLIAGGIISLIAYNWAAISRLSKSVTAIAMLILTQSFGVYLKISKKNLSLRIKEAFSLFWALLFGAVVAFVSQIYRFPSDPSGFLFVWSLSSILITYLFRSGSVFVLSLIQIFSYMIAAWDGHLSLFYLLLVLFLPFVLQKDCVKWQKYTLFVFAALLFAPVIFRLSPQQGRIFFYTVYSSLSLAFILGRNKDFKVIASFALLCLLSVFAASFCDSHFNSLMKFSENGNLFEHSLTYFVSAILIVISLGKPFRRIFFKKERSGVSISLIFLPFLFPLVIFLGSFNPGIAFSILTLVSLFFSVIFALKEKFQTFFPILGFSVFCIFIKLTAYPYPLLSFAFFLLFLISLLLLRENFFKTDTKSVFFIFLRTLVASLPVFLYIGLWQGPFAPTFREETLLKKSLLENLILYLPQLVFSLGAVVFLAKKDFKKLLPIADIFLNLFLVISLESLVKLGFITDERLLFIICDLPILLSSVFAAVRYIFFKNSEFLPYLLAAFVKAFLVCFFTGKEADFLWTFASVVFFLHIFGRFTEFKALSKICQVTSTVINGIAFFIENVFFTILFGIPVDYKPFPTNAWNVIYISLILALCLLLCICLIRKKEIFNIAMIFHISLFTENESLQILALPALTIFCLYYFFTAYKENSAKKANFTAIYFTVVLMVRFFTLGYGLVSQGISLILLGIALLLINRLIGKKQ